MRVELNDLQVDDLVELVDRRQHEFLMEISRSDARNYRTGLQREYDRLDGLSAQLRHGRDYATAERALPIA